MNYDEWAPAYEAIRRDFGYSRAADERGRDILAGEIEAFDLDRLPGGGTVAVVGGAAGLPGELDQVAAADGVFAASTAVDVLADHGVEADLMVTDLDGHPGTARDRTHGGMPVAVHAHGDNVDAVRERVPGFAREHVLGTTQVEPRGPVRNVGGFTDGDRAAFLADHLGADELTFPGWRFDDPRVTAEKRHKLHWAARLLHWLERRRGEQFPLLDDRRADLALPWLA